MVYNVSSGSILLNVSNDLTQEVLFLEILFPFCQLRLSNEYLIGHQVAIKVIYVVQKRARWPLFFIACC